MSALLNVIVKENVNLELRLCVRLREVILLIGTQDRCPLLLKRGVRLKGVVTIGFY